MDNLRHRHPWQTSAPSRIPPAPIRTSVNKNRPSACQFTPNNAISHRPPLPNDPQVFPQPTKNLLRFIGIGRLLQRWWICRGRWMGCDRRILGAGGCYGAGEPTKPGGLKVCRDCCSVFKNGISQPPVNIFYAHSNRHFSSLQWVTGKTPSC